MTTAERDEHYRMLNDRFEVRSALLREAGFTYAPITEGVAAFTRKRDNRTHHITSATVLLADEIVWADHVESIRR